MFNSLVSKIIVTFVFLCVAPLLLLNFVYFKNNAILTERSMKDSLQKLVEEKSQVIASELKLVEIELDNLASFYIINDQNKLDGDTLPAYYQKDSRGVIGRQLTKDLYSSSNRLMISYSNIFLPSQVKITSKIRKDIIKTERLDPILNNIMKQNSNIVWVYIVTSERLLRLYPYIDNTIFQSNHDQHTDPFYKIVSNKNIKDSSAMWTNPYYDYAGKGWVITCSKPVFVNGELNAVVCIDVSLNNLRLSMADFSLSKSGFAFLIDRNGNIIYHPNYMPTNSKEGDTLNRNLLKEIQSDDYKNIIRSMIKKETGISNYKDIQYNSNNKLLEKNDSDKIIAYTPIQYLNGSIGIQIDRNDYIPSAGNFPEKFITFTVIAAILIMMFGIYIFIRISKPILKLAHDVKTISAGDYDFKFDINTNDEIGILSDAFNSMNKQIKSYTADIVKSKNQLETVFNGVGGLLMILDKDYTIKILNRQADFQKNPEHAQGEKCYKAIVGIVLPCLNCPIKATLETKKEAFGEIIHEKNVYHIWSYPIKNEYGEIEEMVVYSTQVTDIILLEQELAQAEKLAGIGQSVAGVMHELKNPIAIIKGASYLLHNYLHPDRVEQVQVAMEEIDNSVLRAENIIFNLLDFSRTSKNQKEYIDICKLIHQILLFDRELIVKQKIEVLKEFETTPLLIYGYLDSVKHIFLNIIANAVQAMKSGGNLMIGGRYQHESNTVQIYIRDTGYGIASKDIEKIFEPFFTTKEYGEGTGLGLWIVLREIEKNNGNIEVNSSIGEGAEFRLTFYGCISKEGQNEHTK